MRLAVLSKMFALAEIWEWRPEHTNPVRGIERYPERKRERITTMTELARIGQAIDAAEAGAT